jgi:dTDP-4-amino-4,6-dideoxygalactose transaminase
MPDWVVPLSDVRFGEAEVQAVADAYRSGWLSQGPKVAAFESAFAAFVGAGHAIAVASGTAALQLICAGISLAPGDEVVVPSLTFAATAAAVHHAGARPVFADVRGPHQPWLSVDAVRDVIGSRTKAIINVSYGGHPGEALELLKLASECGVTLIEDAAHALGAWQAGRQAGTIGRAGAFSFFANKNLPLGEGGMVVTDDAALAGRMRLLRSHGLSSDTWARHHGDEVDYEVLEPGFNFRLDEPRAALGLTLLARFAADNDRRAALARSYAEALAPVEGVEPALSEPTGGRSAWHIFPVLLDREIDRGAFRARLRAAGIQTSVHYPPLHRTRAFSAAAADLPKTDDYASRTVTLPMFSHMKNDQQEHVIRAVQGARSAAAV